MRVCLWVCTWWKRDLAWCSPDLMIYYFKVVGFGVIKFVLILTFLCCVKFLKWECTFKENPLKVIHAYCRTFGKEVALPILSLLPFCCVSLKTDSLKTEYSIWTSVFYITCFPVSTTISGHWSGDSIPVAQIIKRWWWSGLRWQQLKWKQTNKYKNHL